MATETTYTALRQNLASFLDRVIDDREVLLVKRRNARDVAILPADELAGLAETAYLLRSPKNAERLMEALAESRKLDRRGVPVQAAATAIRELRRFIGLEPKGDARKVSRRSR